MKKKKIHIISKYFYPVTAGIEVNILETYKFLVKKGWQVTVHTSRDTLKEKNVLSERDNYAGIRIIRYPYRWYGYFPRINWKSSSIIAIHNFNVSFHTLFIYLKVLALNTFVRRNFRLVLTPHGGFNPEWSIFPWLVARVKAFYHYSLGAFLVNKAVDGVRAVSKWEKQQMIKKGISGKLIKVISNGIEDEAFEDINRLASTEIKEKVQSLGRYIIRIGRIYPIKNDETTIKALPYIDEDIKYVVVGPIHKDSKNKGYFNYLKKLARSLHVEDRVEFLGVIRGIDKYYLMKNAQMMVHMALWESFCNVVHEAMSQGLPVVVANNTALPYLVKDGINGYLVDTKDYKEVAERIHFVLKNKNSSELEKISRLNRKSARKHAWKNVATKMDIFYKELLLR